MKLLMQKKKKKLWWTLLFGLILKILFSVIQLIDNNSQPGSDTKIQLPFLDDNAYPSAIAVPLKEHPLFSLMSECAVNIVPKYYILAMRCLSSGNYTNKDIINFNKQLHRWIIATVVPHLHEIERWYPGFGSIMRVVETMNQRGLASTEIIKQETKETNKTICVEFPIENTCTMSSNIVLWVIIVMIVLFSLIVVLCVIRCCVSCIRARKSGEAEAKDNFTNTLVNLYCGIKGRQPPAYSAGEVPQRRGSSRRAGSSAASYEGGESSEEEYETE